MGGLHDCSLSKISAAGAGDVSHVVIATFFAFVSTHRLTVMETEQKTMVRRTLGSRVAFFALTLTAADAAFAGHSFARKTF